MPIHRSQEGGIQEDVCDETCTHLAKCILSHYNQVSVTRLHNLAFLSEATYYYEKSAKLTPARHTVTMEGVYSKELEGVVNDLSTVEEGTVRIGGERIETLSVSDEVECPFDNDDAQEIVEDVVESYGTISQQDMNELIEGIEMYQETKLGQVLPL
jgi:hypothetical protein